METRAHYVAVGAFVLTMVVLAFVAVLWMARSSLTTDHVRYDIYFKGPVTGLRQGASVEYNGVPVGKVDEIKIVPFERKFVEEEEPGDTTPADETAPSSMIRVTAEIDANVEIKQDVRASVETPTELTEEQRDLMKRLAESFGTPISEDNSLLKKIKSKLK